MPISQCPFSFGDALCSREYLSCVQSGNDRQCIFYDRHDYFYFLRALRKCVVPAADLIVYTSMPNPFHLMLYADERCERKFRVGGLSLDIVTNSVRLLLSQHTCRHNYIHKRSGSLFRQKTKAKCLTEISNCLANPLDGSNYSVSCFHYIHQNPLRAKLVTRMEEWEYSSFRDYAGLRNGSLCNKELARKFCGYAPDTFLQDSYALVAQLGAGGLY
jgi:putative transposase